MGTHFSCLWSYCGKMNKYRKLGGIAPCSSGILKRKRKSKSSDGTSLYVFDLQGMTVVKDHEGARRALMYVPGWVEQAPRDGCLEYWFFLSFDRERRWPAAKARLPWPVFHDAPIPILQAFVHVVNRVAHRTILCLIAPAEMHHMMRKRTVTASRVRVNPYS